MGGAALGAVGGAPSAATRGRARPSAPAWARSFGADQPGPVGRRKQQQQQQQMQAQQQRATWRSSRAPWPSGRANYDRAFNACMSGRGYTAS